MITKNRKVFDELEELGYTEEDVRDFCEGYLELLAAGLMDGITNSKVGIADTKLARKTHSDKLIVKYNGKLYVEEK